MKIRRPPAHYLTLLLLWLFFAQTLGAGPHLSLTADEPVHMAQGYVYWARGDFRLQRPVAQPPLPDLLPGAFLMLQPGPDVEELTGWQDADLTQFTRDFTAWYGQRGALPAATFVSRAPITLVAVLGIAIAYRWTREIFGLKGAFVTTILLVCDPNLIAHAGLATTDVLLTIWTFAAVYCATQWIKSQAVWPWGLFTGAALGLALGSKSSGFFAVGIVGLLFCLQILKKLLTEERITFSAFLHATLRWGKRLGLALGVAFFVLWALYRFELRPLPEMNLPIPFATQWVIWREMTTHLREGHIAYLMGETSYTGWWYYYPLAFLLKTPLPILILLLGTAILGLTTPLRQWWRRHYLWLTPSLYAVAAVNSRIDIGYRYLLVMLPFLYVLCGGLARLQRRWQQTLIAGLLLWLTMGAIGTFPHYLAYFNPLTRGPRDAADYLVDSNLDWGQGFVALREWLTEHSTPDPLFISYYTFVDPAHYGLDYTPLAPAPDAPPILEQRFDPKPGTYAISATPLRGVMIAQEESYSWFRQREPTAHPANAIFVYEIAPGRARPHWLAQCTVPVIPLTQEAIEEGFGEAELRHITFDCAQSWVYPEGGRSPGQYALFRETAMNTDAFGTRRLQDVHLSYEQQHTGELSPFRLYEHPPSKVAPTHRAEGQIQVGEALLFLGYALPDEKAQGDDILIVETYWRVREPAAEPLSIMLHLLGPGGTPAVVGDGLGYPSAQWQAGDVFIQKHTLSLPPDAPAGAYTIHTGAYDLETITPYPIRSSNETIGGRLQLTTLHIP